MTWNLSQHLRESARNIFSWRLVTELFCDVQELNLPSTPKGCATVEFLGENTSQTLAPFCHFCLPLITEGTWIKNVRPPSHFMPTVGLRKIYSVTNVNNLAQSSSLRTLPLPNLGYQPSDWQHQQKIERYEQRHHEWSEQLWSSVSGKKLCCKDVIGGERHGKFPIRPHWQHTTEIADDKNNQHLVF